MEDISTTNEEKMSSRLSVTVGEAEYMEEVMKLTLKVASVCGMDSGLDMAYAQALLLDDPDYPPTGLHEGVPEYPLYKQIASALYECVSSGTFGRPCDKMTLMPVYRLQKQREDLWIKTIKEIGSELLDILKSVDFELHVQEPYFSQIKDEVKTVEGRCAVGDYNRIVRGALILFNKCLVFKVQDVRKYASFSEMLESEGLSKVLPGVKTINEGVQVYQKFYSEEKERLNGVLAISLTRPPSQTYITICPILWDLGCGGFQRLLGLTHTPGIVKALPPPRLTLLSSFQLPHNPDVQGSTLTNGARALSKHVTRNSSLYWGDFQGSDSDKNMHALEVIREMIAHCCWQNLHMVPPHGTVYEIRVADGYGARWSKDGTKDSLNLSRRMAILRKGNTSPPQGPERLVCSICN